MKSGGPHLNVNRVENGMAQVFYVLGDRSIKKQNLPVAILKPVEEDDDGE